MTNAANDREPGASVNGDAPGPRPPDAASDEGAAPDPLGEASRGSASEASDPGPTAAGRDPSDVADRGAADDAGAAPDDVVAALAEARRERDAYLDHLRRERAEFDNFRRRSVRERTEALDRGAEALVAQLLSVLDNFGYVLEAAKDSDDAVAKGVRMVHTELREALTRSGLEDVPGVGSPFDPNWHDAVMQVEGETTEDGEPTVAQVLRQGYRFKGRVLRPASVAVTQ